MARNRFPGYCYCCGAYVPTGYGHFERHYGTPGIKWRIKCVKCASGRTVSDNDREVLRAIKRREELRKMEGQHDREAQ